jgi:NAD(P)-dependent dehydrogenase (short-subunit alcohol dehydrogenase family)
VLNESINAHLGMPQTTVYGATKADVINMAKTLSAELLERGIRVNAVSPGWIGLSYPAPPKSQIRQGTPFNRKTVPPGEPFATAASLITAATPERIRARSHASRG